MRQINIHRWLSLAPVVGALSFLPACSGAIDGDVDGASSDALHKRSDAGTEEAVANAEAEATVAKPCPYPGPGTANELPKEGSATEVIWKGDDPNGTGIAETWAKADIEKGEVSESGPANDDAIEAKTEKGWSADDQPIPPGEKVPSPPEARKKHGGGKPYDPCAGPPKPPPPPPPCHGDKEPPPLK